MAIYNVRLLIASRPICMLELQLEMSCNSLWGFENPLLAAWQKPEYAYPCSSLAGEALSYVQDRKV